MGLSGLFIGFVIPVKHEKRTLIAVPALGSMAVLALPHTGGGGAFAMAALCGVGFAGVIPVTIAMAQRLLPHRTGLASGLMMGGAWCIAGVGPILAQRLAEAAGLNAAFAAVAALLLLAGLVSLAIPASAIARTE
jgi:MFS family permease